MQIQTRLNRFHQKKKKEFAAVKVEGPAVEEGPLVEGHALLRVWRLKGSPVIKEE